MRSTWGPGWTWVPREKQWASLWMLLFIMTGSDACVVRSKHSCDAIRTIKTKSAKFEIWRTRKKALFSTWSSVWVRLPELFRGARNLQEKLQEHALTRRRSIEQTYQVYLIQITSNSYEYFYICKSTTYTLFSQIFFSLSPNFRYLLNSV